MPADKAGEVVTTRGGAYWGLPSNVYGVWAHIDGETVCTYVRANSRIAAINKVKAGEV